MKLRTIVLLMTVMITGTAAESFDGAFGTLDSMTVGTDPDLVSLVVPRVESIDDGSPAKAMGLKVGDRLVGLDGLQVMGKAEWDLVRYRRPQTPADIRIAVLRDDRVIELRNENLLSGRRVGFFSLRIQRREWRL